MSKFYTYVIPYKYGVLHIGHENGKRFQRIEKFSPKIAIKTTKESEWKTLHDENVEFLHFNDIASYNTYIKQNSESIELFGNIGIQYQFIAHEYPGEVEYDFNDIRIFLLDIEVGSDAGFPHPNYAAKPITAITICDVKLNCYYTLSLCPFDTTKATTKKKVYFKHCASEEELIERFIKIFENIRPDVLVAHNGQNFDYPYIINRIRNLCGEQTLCRLSPIGRVYSSDEVDANTGRISYSQKIMGLSLLDFLLLDKKYSLKTRESHSLQKLAEEELKSSKLKYDEYDNISEFMAKDPQGFVDYNIIDVELIYELEQKMGLIELHVRNAYYNKCNIEDAMSPLRAWDSLVYNHLLTKKQVIPPNVERHKVPFPGAYVMQPNPRINGWCVSFDVNSLYPSLIRQIKISPEMQVGMTLDKFYNMLVHDSQKMEEFRKSIPKDSVNYDKKMKFLDELETGLFRFTLNQEEIDERLLHEELPLPSDQYIIAGNGEFFKKDKPGILPELCELIYNERVKTKKIAGMFKKLHEKIIAEIEHRESNKENSNG